MDELVASDFVLTWVACQINSIQFLPDINFPRFSSHYENMSMIYIDFSQVAKIEKFQKKIVDIFLSFAQNIDCGYTLEPPRRCGSNEYPQSMFWIEINLKKIDIPC